jgi:hypothetical protein
MSPAAGAHIYRAAIQNVLAVHGPLVMAEMRIEESGEYAGAVRVFVAGERIGSVALDQTGAYGSVVRKLNDDGMPTTCRALIEVHEYVNVWLAAKPEPRLADDPFIPELGVGVPVSLNEDGLDAAEAVLGSRAKNKRVKRVVELDHDMGEWACVLDQLPIGELPHSSYRYLDAATLAGKPLTARLSVVRQEGHPVRVSVQFPT